jgi:hypothetical protein
MKTQGEHIRTLRRRVDFLKARDYRNSYDAAELGALEWALVNLPPQASKPWVGLDLAEMDAIIDGNMTITDSKLRDAVYAVVIDTMTTLMEKNHG